MTETKPKNILQKHPFITAALVVLGASVGAYHGCTTTYSTISEAKVLKERTIAGKSDENYVLYVNVHEEIEGKKEDRLCALYIRNDKDGKMPLPVLEDFVREGATIFVPYLEKKILPFGTPKSTYQVGCVGTIYSDEVKVLLPGDVTEVLKKELAGTIDQKVQQELRRAKQEMRETYGGKYL